MKNLLALLLCLWSASAFAANPVQDFHTLVTAANTSSVTTLTTSPVTATASGDTCQIQATASGNAALTVSDSKSNSYSLLTPTSGSNPVQEQNDGGWTFTYISPNCVGGAGLTATVSSTAFMFAVDFTGVKNTPTTSPVDVSIGQYTLSQPGSCSVTPTAANELIISYVFTGQATASNTLTANGGFTLLDHANPATGLSVASATLATASAAAHDPGWTSVGGFAFACHTVAYKGTGGGGTTTANPSVFTVN